MVKIKPLLLYHGLYLLNLGAGHTVLSWEVGESHIRNDLSGKTGVGSIGNYNTFLSGELQGQSFDQYAALVDLT